MMGVFLFCRVDVRRFGASNMHGGGDPRADHSLQKGPTTHEPRRDLRPRRTLRPTNLMRKRLAWTHFSTR